MIALSVILLTLATGIGAWWLIDRCETFGSALGGCVLLIAVWLIWLKYAGLLT